MTSNNNIPDSDNTPPISSGEENPLVHPELEGGDFFWKAGKKGVLLLHGLTSTTVEVRTLAQHLLKENYTVSGILLPGHGTTPEDLNQTHRNQWISAARKAYLELKKECDEIYVGGESTGALLSLYLASEFPEIQGLLLYAPAMRLNSSVPNTLMLVSASPFVASVPKKSDRSEEAGLPWQGYKVNPLKAGVQLLQLQLETEKRLSRIYQPVLLVQGCLDETVDLKSGEMILSGIQSAFRESHWMEKSHHVLLLDIERDQVSEMTSVFLRKIQSA